MEDVKNYAIDMLYKSLKTLKISLGYAEKRGAKHDEIDNLRKKIEAVDWLIGLAIKED